MQLGSAIHRVRTDEKLRLERDRTQRYLDLAKTLSTLSDLQEGLQLCIETAMQISGMDCGGFYLFDEASGPLELKYHKGLSPRFIKGVSRYDRASPNVQLVKAGMPIYTTYHALGVPLDMDAKREGLLSVAILPVCHEKEVIGKHCCTCFRV